MSMLTLNMSGGMPPPIQRDLQHNAQQSTPQSGFGAVMKSFSERVDPSKDTENVSKSDTPTTMAPAHAAHMLANASISDAQASGPVGASLGRPAWVFTISADFDSSSSSSEQVLSGASESVPYSDSAKGLAARGFSLSAHNSFGAGDSDTLASKGMPDQGHSAAEPQASSLTDGAVGLRVVHSASHLGASTLLHVSNRGSLSPDGVAQDAHSQSRAASGSFPENVPPASNAAEKSQILDTMTSGGITPILSSNGGALSFLVEFEGETASSLDQTDQVSKSDGSAVVSPPPNARGDGVRELDVRLDPLDLGPMSVKLKLSGSDLSVIIEVPNQKMLSAIECERHTIIDRINSADHQVSSLVLRSSDTSASLSEDGQIYSGVANNESNAQQQTDERSPWRGSGTGKHRPSAENPTPRDNSGDLLV